MARLLAGLGHPFLIHAPDELRAAVRELAERLLESSRDELRASGEP
jgi:predicted DNA-binding transcriptional regulator YafY